jgi:hypothetical protein
LHHVVVGSDRAGFVPRLRPQRRAVAHLLSLSGR